MRRRAALLALALTGITVVSAPASPAAAAYTPFKAVITCDEAANRITTSTAGGAGYFYPNVPVTVEYRVLTGTYVRSNEIGQVTRPAPVRVNATTTADGSLVTKGYTKAWEGTSFDFYSETVRVTVTNRTTGDAITYRDATCSRDTRTTTTVECDPVANTITVRVSGTRYTELDPQTRRRVGSATISYWGHWTYQRAADEPRWATLSPDAFRTRTVPIVDGEWSEGYVVDLPEGYFYRKDEITVVVKVGMAPAVVGRGAGSCEYTDHAG